MARTGQTPRARQVSQKASAGWNPSKVVVAMLVGILLALGLGVYVGNRSAGGAAAGGVIHTAGPTGLVNGVPVGYEKSETGAVTAATMYHLALSGSQVFGPERQAVIDTVFAPESEQVEAAFIAGLDRVNENTDQAVTRVAASVPGRAAVVAYSESSAELLVWGASLYSSIDGGWGATRYVLTWVDGDWKVADVQPFNEPSPEATGPELAQFLQRFDWGYRYVPTKAT